MSQSEIDALLSAVSSGELDVEEIKEEDNNKKVKKYDFKNPQKISKEQLRTLEVIHENFGRYMQTFLTGYLRTNVSVEILTVDQFAYSEFNNAVPTPAFLSIIDFSPLKGEILIELSNNLIYTIIDRLLGGDGKEHGDFKALTEIELSLLTNMMEKLIGDLSTAWKNVIDLEPSLEKIETNPQFAQIVPPNETIALITMSLEVGQREGMMNICIPYILLEPIIDKLNTKYWFSSARRDKSSEDKLLIKDRILNTVVPVVAELGYARVTVNEIVNLDLGDVIVIDSKGEDVRMRIGSNVKFIGEMGQVNNKMAVQINKLIKEGEAVNE